MGHHHRRRGLVVGNYCHDVLLKDNIIIATSLGGAASFISNIFTHLSISCDYISKVGPDFKYTPPVPSPPIVAPTSPTTVFHAHFSTTGAHHPNSSDRTLKRVTACDPIRPDDLPTSSGQKIYSFGMAVGVGGEITPDILAKMSEICELVFVDIQGLIREFDITDGSVRLIHLENTEFYPLIGNIGVLKASAEEAEYIDVEQVRKLCCVVVTNGEDGCRVYWKDGELKIAPFSAFQVDPTGAGDSLLGGFVAGLVSGLAVPDAALLGNFFGSLTVGHIGLPTFDIKLLQTVKDEVLKRTLQCAEQRVGDEDELWFSKPDGHEEFHASLNALRQDSASSALEYKSILPEVHDHSTEPRNHCANHLCCAQKALHDPVYDDPLEFAEGAP